MSGAIHSSEDTTRYSLQTYGLFAVAFLISMAMTQASLGIVFYAQDIFQASPRQIGWLGGMFSLIYLISCLTIQFFLHRVSPGILVFSATGLLGMIYMGILFSTTLTSAFVLIGLTGIVGSCFWPPLVAWISKGLKDSALNHRIAGFNVSWCLGGILGPWICGELSEWSVSLPLATSSGLAFLTTGLVVILLFRKPDNIQPQNTDMERTPVKQLSPPLHDTPYRYPAWIGLLATYFCIGIISFIFPMMARKQLLFTGSLIGLLLLIRVLFNTLMFFLLGRTAFWHYRGWPIIISQLISILMMVGLVFTQTPLIIGVLLAGFGISGALGYVSSMFHGMVGSSRKGNRMAVHESLVSLGMVSGSVIGGTVCQTHALSTTYWIGAGVLTAALLIQSVLTVRIRCQVSSDPA